MEKAASSSVERDSPSIWPGPFFTMSTTTVSTRLPFCLASSDYLLMIEPSDTRGCWVYFSTQGSGGILRTTARDLIDYPLGVQQVVQGAQYVEVGPGIGGFIPFLSQNAQTGRIPLPIAIDPANYLEMRRLLLDARAEELGDEVCQRLDILVERCNIMLDSRMVRLIPMRLEEAVRRFPDLAFCGDVVVSNNCIDIYGSPQERLLLDRLCKGSVFLR